ncbi:MAG: sodium-dependent transporter [Bacteroidales bacterium]|nr:sodium-dependent transporter [Bacteroidales bacterium]
MGTKRENFGGRGAAILALAGSAIGLGNIWRFPYMVGQMGGAAFIIIYLISCLLLSLPIFLAEAIIGHRTHAGTFGAMERLAPGTKWKWLGLLTVLSPLVILSYYSVVGGWSIGYLWQSVTEGFHLGEIGAVSSAYGRFISSPGAPLLFHTLFLLGCAWIVSAGVKSGIERFNKVTMPLLFVLIVLIMGYSVSLPGAEEGVRYLLKPDFSKITPSAIAAAMGQSFFSLSLGVGTILTYASYIRRDENILATGLGTVGFDLLFALIAGFAIMPAVFAAGIEPGAGPGLIFETLPYIFAKMGASAPVLSAVVAVLFFVTIVFAAFTSAISMYEVGVTYLVEQRGLSRRKATVLIFLGTWTLGALCSLSFGPLSEVKLFGRSIFSFCDFLTSNFLMTFGGLLFVLFVGWKMDKAAVRDEFTVGGTARFNCAVFDAFWFLLRYVAPVAIVVIFFTNFLA